MTDRADRLRGITLMIAAVAVFGVMDALMKFLAETYPPMEIASLRGAMRLFRQSELRGFRNLLVSLPPDAPSEQQFRLRLRLVRTTWKLIGIELPDALLRRAIRDLAGRTAPAEVKAPPQ